MPTAEFLGAYWSSRELVTNGIILLNLFGALVLGMLVGYERAYHGRAAGMRTVACQWGYAGATEPASWEADYLVDTPEALLALVLESHRRLTLAA